MNIKIWREPNGRDWTVAMYGTPECKEGDVPDISPAEHQRILEWIEANHPTAWYSRVVGLIQFCDNDTKGAESATLFKLSFATTAVTA